MTRTAIVTAPPDLGELIARVSVASAGGVATFLGIVRDHNDGRAVTLLEYHVYETMAERELAAIADEISQTMSAAQLSMASSSR